MEVSANKSKPLPNKSCTKNSMQPYRHGLYLDLKIGDIDARTQTGRAHKALTSYLREHVGDGSVIKELLISRIVFKSLKLFSYESEELSKGLSDNISVYLSISNSLRKDLAELDRMAAAPKEQDLRAYLAEHYGKTGN